ncbi:MAG: DUF3617 domain-containing protein [Gammaproteobacteria bacterium]
MKPRHALALASLLVSLPLLAQPGSGTQWELTMQIPGMEDMQMPDMGEMPEGFEMPEGMSMPSMGPGGMTQKVCMPKDPEEPPPAQSDCRVVEQKSSGNRHRMTMDCPDGRIEIDQTRTASTMTTRMRNTDKSGEVTEMTMNGRLLGSCDYGAQQAALARSEAKVRKQIEEGNRAATAQMDKICREGLDQMRPELFVGSTASCGPLNKEFCERLASRDGYRKAHAHVREMGSINPEVPDLAKQMKGCGLQEATVLKKLCPEGVAAPDFGFVGAYCPAERAALCPKAVAAEKLGYVSRHCPAERERLVAQHCAGRKYSSDIPEKYRAFCVGALGADLKGGGGGEDAAQPVKAEDKVKEGVKKGVEGLKKVFDF